MIAIAALPGAVDKAKIVGPPSIDVLVDLLLEYPLVRYSAEFGNMGPRDCGHRLFAFRADGGRLVRFCRT